MKTSLRAILIASVFGIFFNQQAKSQCQGGFDTTMTGALTVHFTSQAVGNNLYMDYDFGDGNYIAYVPNPTHTYAGPGIYVACQFIYDTIGGVCQDYYCDTLYLGGATCEATFYPYTDGLDLQVYNAALGQYDSIWFDFGDGNGSSSSMPLHTYANPGQYTVCMSLYDNGSICDSSCASVWAYENDCEANFSTTASGLTVNFNNLSQGGYDIQYWDFEGWGDSEDANPTFTFPAPGTYEVCLYITDTLTWSCSDDICMDVTVTSGGGGSCQADFSFTNDELDVQFTNASTNYTFLVWDFGDGSAPSFDENPAYAYAAPGTYEVCLTVGSIIPLCTNEYCVSITVNEYTCEPEFSYSHDAQNQYTFTNLTTVGNVTSVLWSFGDGNTSAFDEPVYLYNSPGIYNVCLTTFDEGNECGQTCKEVAVAPLGVEDGKLQAEFKVYPNPSNGNFVIQVPESQLGETLNIQVLDVSGRIVASTSDGGRSSIEMSTDLPSGAYYLTVGSASAETQVIRILIQ